MSIMKIAAKLAITVLVLLLVLAALGRLIHWSRAESAFDNAADPGLRRSASRLDSEIGDYFKAAGDTWLHVAIPPQPALAVQAYGQAVRQDAYGSLHWLDWGRACLRSGDREQARKAFATALALDPQNQTVQLEAGNYFLEAGDPAQAAAHHARAIQLNPVLARILYPVYWGLGVNPAQVAEQLGLSGTTLAPTYFIDCLTAAEPAQIRQVWDDFQRRGVKFAPAVSELYFAYLQARADRPALLDLWSQIVRGNYGKSAPNPAQPFWNGDLRLPPTFNGGLEWRIRLPLPAGVEVTSSTTGGVGGGGCLDLRFSGQENVALNHLHHRFLAEPGATYELSAHYRAKKITTQYGLYLAVRLPGAPAVKPSDPLILGTGEGSVRLKFTVPPGCGLGELDIRRDHCPYFSNRIAGQVQLSDFRLEKVVPEQNPAKPTEGTP